MALLSTVSSAISSDFLVKFWLPTITQLRHNRPNLQRPLPLHYNRKRMLEVCKPRYPEKPKVCQKYKEKKTIKLSLDEKPYHRFVARQLATDLFSHPMIAIFHANSFTQLEFQNIHGMLFDVKFDMRLSHRINYVVARNAMEGTKFEPVLQLVVPSNTIFGYCSTTDVPKLIRVLRKMPQFLLIGLVLENRLLHRADVDKIAKLPNIDLMRSQLCSTLNLAGQNLYNTLQSNQSNLVHNLKIYSSSNETELNPNYNDEKK